jgi:hypothetical protein
MLVSARQASRPAEAPSEERYLERPLLNNQASLLALTITFVVISWICSILRLYVRLLVQRNPGWDDFFIVLTMLSTTIGSIVLCTMTNIGLGHPMLSLPPDQISNGLRAIYIATSTYPLSSTFIKVALLLQYLRHLTGPRIRLFCKFVLGFTILSGVTFSICSWFSCLPVAAFWDTKVTGSHCWGFASRDQKQFVGINVTQVVVTAVLDLVVFLIPSRLYFSPETLKTARLSMFGLFFLGLAATMCSVWRAVYIIKLTLVEKFAFDPMWDNPTVMGLASLEVHLAAVCAALPIFWPVIKQTWNRIMVTFEVSVTTEVELVQTASTDRNLGVESIEEREGWEPFVGDETTGLGKNKTVVESAAAGKWSRRAKELMGKR